MNDVVKLDPGAPGADEQMMGTPDMWPLFPVLPVVSREDGTLGVMVCMRDLPRTAVWSLSMFDERVRSLLFGKERDPALRSYGSIEEVAEEWTVGRSADALGRDFWGWGVEHMDADAIEVETGECPVCHGEGAVAPVFGGVLLDAIPCPRGCQRSEH